ncbi:MAG: LysM peptidoglycan-binding domain-containing protein [Planctomycetota bacterium]|nr:LysM peptidoglycan-binding domain-containing protein [Planctomycetota bacterium]
MGKTEKIVVLSVLFAVVVLFVWSLQGPEARAAANANANAGLTSDPGTQEGAANVFQRVAPDERRPVINLEPPVQLDDLSSGAEVAGTEAEQASNQPGLLNSMIMEPETEVEQGVQLQQGWDLVSTRGLEPTVDPMMLILRPAAGATWGSLARDLYGDESRSRLLRHYNEGMDVPGAQVLVPAVDDLGAAPMVQRVEVLDGESLWLVAERTLGSGARWKEIFELNRGVISDASKVRAGMVLTIPSAD